MKRESLLVRPRENGAKAGVVTQITAEQAGWDLLNLTVRRFTAGQVWTDATGECEAALVILSGRCSVQSDKGSWDTVGQRADVFSGMPSAVYFSRRTEFTVTALNDDLEIAHCWVATDEDHPARLIRPEDSVIEIRGGRNATRQINTILPPGFDCHRIVCVEVYTPGGNWSSYPPHKHDVHREDATGRVLEADLEEIYYYKVAGPRGYAIQRVYTDDRSLDEVVVAHNNDMVLVPEGYHPVSAAYGYDCYYLNFLAGSAQSLANADDPDYAWVTETWDQQDPRVPLVTHATATAEAGS